MKDFGFLLLTLFQTLSVAFLWHLWTHEKQLGVLERILLSVLLMAPFLGWLFYLFIRLEPKPHGEEPAGPYG